MARGFGRLHVLEQDRELVAGQARDHVRLAHAAAQAARDLLQHLVAGEVAQAVVDDLEAVDVDVEQAEAVARRRAASCAIARFRRSRR